MHVLREVLSQEQLCKAGGGRLAAEMGKFLSLAKGVQKQRRTLCVRPTWCQAQHSANPAKTPISPALACEPRHGDGPGGDQGDRPTSGNAHVASGTSPRTPCCPQGALLGGTWGSVLLSLWEGRSGGPRDLRTRWRVRNCRRRPETQRQKAGKVPFFWLGAAHLAGHPERCVAAVGAWLRHSQKGTRGRSTPEGEGLKFLLMVRQRHPQPLG